MKVQCLGCFDLFESVTPPAVISGADVCPTCRRLISLGRAVEAKKAECAGSPSGRERRMNHESSRSG